MTLLALALIAQQPRAPIEFGKRELARVLGPKAADVQLRVSPGGVPESYAITHEGGKAVVTAPDQTGAMYGAFEFAERVQNEGEKAWGKDVKGSPYLRERGLNLFLTLPWDYVKNDTDYAVASLTDAEKWWFHNEDYWTSLLDLMAKSRLNWLDIHGTWDISVTDAPNLYAYFVTAPSFPQVGVPENVKLRNMQQLNHVIAMAHARGIRVSLMAYQASLRIPQNPNPPYEQTEENVYKYTREAVEQMVRGAPALDAIGFRIGESGHGESFFNCYGEGVKNSGRDIPLITRSWITRRQQVLPLARASKDFTVEIKYNGEQWGAPYMVAGGRVANWYSYSFEDYLSDAGSPEKNAKTWPGNPVSDPLSRLTNEAIDAHTGAGGGLGRGPEQSPNEERWPSNPYKIVWQVRANGTHRIFPFYNPEWVRRTIGCMKIGTASGYTIEGLDAYYPKKPDYYLADPSKKAYDWIHQRDEMYWTTWGRLGYDPTVPDSTFDKQAVRMLGEGTEKLVQAWKQASVQVPLAFMAYALGPDHRSHAPELEWGGDTSAFIQGQGFDTHSFLPINELLANRATSGVDGRRGPEIQPTTRLTQEDLFHEAMIGNNLAAAGIARASLYMQDLWIYFVSRTWAAAEYGTIEAEVGVPRKNRRITDALSLSQTALNQLVSSGSFRPFTERLRMHTNTFTWRSEAERVALELKRIEALQPAREFVLPPLTIRASGKLSADFDERKVNCALSDTDADRAWLLVKPLPSSTYFHRVPMNKEGNTFVASFDRKRWGHMVAVEAAKGDSAARFPDAMKETPYLVVPSLPGPTPQIYSAEEALTYLKPEVITPEKYGAMIIGTRGWRFFSSFDRTMRRKVLLPVERGMKLLILQQDFNRYNLDFLPKPLRFEGGNWTTFDPAGQLGLEKTDTADVMWQRFLPSEGWDVFGNGGLARLKIGKGEVWVCSARLMQRMHIPSAARNFVKLLGIGGKEKPTVLIDSNSEGADFSSSNHPDLMNSHDVPFLTLGEVIANEQGMDSFTPVPGPTLDDDVLAGKGKDMANAWLRAQVVAKAKRPAPTSIAEFEVERQRRKKELLRSLGLDPMPEKTPLNARTTGSLLRTGYRIEKVVFESRPSFFVTAHVYVPYPPLNHRAPVIVNVNGHWAHKKDEDRIQLRAAFQAIRGYIAIAIDSPGWSFEGNSLIERRAEGNHNDFKLVQGGTNATGYYVWDAIRALDYMATRSDTDMEHVGITGASGGGLATLYTFAADDRYDAAVPVVYMASMELAPDNGCLCNHVPGTMLVGDRSDVLAIQAPKPVYIMGAQDDPEFPPAATNLTVEKARQAWALFGKLNDVHGQVFAGPHDYNRPMREAMIGFFDKYLRGVGDGSPVSQPNITTINPEDRSLLVLDPAAPDEKTMRQLSMQYLEKPPKNANFADVVAINGGMRTRTPLDYKETGRVVTFRSEAGFTTPAILQKPSGTVKGVRIVLDDAGKSARSTPARPDDGFVTLFMDALGTGELKDVELRYPVYLGRSVAFIAAWQIVRAKEAMKKYSEHVEVEAHGPLTSLAALYAALMDPTIEGTTADGVLREWKDVFQDDVPDAAVQPRAHLLPALEDLRTKVRNGKWIFRQAG